MAELTTVHVCVCVCVCVLCWVAIFGTVLGECM